MRLEEARLEGGTLVTIKHGQNGECRSCNAPIVWAITNKNAKSIPVVETKNGGWQAHFVDCPGADKFRKPKTGDGDRMDDIKRQKQREVWT